MTPELWPVWCAPGSRSFSSTVTFRRPEAFSARPVARPTMPPPMMAMSRKPKGLSCFWAPFDKLRVNGGWPGRVVSSEAVESFGALGHKSTDGAHLPVLSAHGPRRARLAARRVRLQLDCPARPARRRVRERTLGPREHAALRGA